MESKNETRNDLRPFSEPLPSKIFQNHVKDIILNNEPLTTTFLNSMLNQLNWAFSEFIGMLQEIQNISSRPERVFIESRQLKICATCFDLSLALLRVLEMVSTLCVGVFTDPNRPNSELLLSRLYQVCFQYQPINKCHQYYPFKYYIFFPANLSNIKSCKFHHWLFPTCCAT